MKAKPIFVGGTTSNAGKSWMATAICAWLRERGHTVAPFKAQNMSNNSYACRSGGEIGRAQAAQAEACGLEPETDMNPILLKPDSDTGSQVVLEGRVWNTLRGREYYEHFDFLLGRVLAAYDRLAAKYEYIVIEGAGSVAELNLKSRDLCNLGLATRLDAPGLLVSDIDRGGVFASIIGTYSLLEPNERALLRSFAVNRFRGDASLFTSGVEILEAQTGSPCLGVFPMARDIELDPEDGVCLDETPSSGRGDFRIAIVRLPHISNFTDFRLLVPTARWITHPQHGHFDHIFLPGTKNTLGDLAWLRETGLVDWILEQARAGAAITGICGGYQIMGESIDGVPALSLLPVETEMRPEKLVRPVEAATPSGIRFPAYEIHMGATQNRGQSPITPFSTLADGTPEGVRLDRFIGTYLHGALENAAVLSEILGRPIAPAAPKQHHYARLAQWFADHQHRFEELYL